MQTAHEAESRRIREAAEAPTPASRRCHPPSGALHPPDLLRCLPDIVPSEGVGCVRIVAHLQEREHA